MEQRARADLLTAEGVCVYFQGIKAVDDVSLEIPRGRITGLIGPNGAGKSTFFNAVSGFVPLTAGKVVFGEHDITKWSPTRVAKHGVVRTFQDTRIFKELSVLENVELGAMNAGHFGEEGRRYAMAALELLGIAHLAPMQAGNVALGDGRRAGIARAMATQPDILMLDEPAAGLDDHETAALAQSIVDLRREIDCGVLLVEHDMAVIFSICEWIHVLDYGKTISSGTPDEVRRDPAVIEAYFGKETA